MYIYYVYQYLRKDLTPYYIGKGKNDRVSRKHRVPIPKDKSLVRFVAINLSEHEAHLLEKKLILHYGRKDIGTGILLNMTEGGEGTSGRLHSKETRRKISAATKGRFKGIPQTAEVIAKRTAHSKGKTRIKSVCRISDKKEMTIYNFNRWETSASPVGSNNINAKTYEIISPTGEIFIICGTLREFCKQHGFYPAAITNIAKNRVTAYKGWTARYV